MTENVRAIVEDIIAGVPLEECDLRDYSAAIRHLVAEVRSLRREVAEWRLAYAEADGDVEVPHPFVRVYLARAAQ
jgi:hypothetical protein